MMVETLREAEETGAAMVRTAIDDIEAPDEKAAQQAADAVRLLNASLGTHPGATAHLQLAGDDLEQGSTSVAVPAIALGIFLEVLDELAGGNAVAVGPVPTELTTQQAADLLNVSRPYLIRLLEDEQIPYRRVGNRRKILLVHLVEYQRHDEAHRRRVADKLTREAERIGLEY